MKRKDAEELVFLVQDHKSLKALEYYASLRQEWLKNQLVSAKDMNEVLQLQGAIYELGRIFRLKDEVMNPTET